MRINVYAEEITDRVERVSKNGFVGYRMYLALPVTMGNAQVSGPFMHHPGDDDSSAITFWANARTRAALIKLLDLMEPDRVVTSVNECTNESPQSFDNKQRDPNRVR